MVFLNRLLKLLGLTDARNMRRAIWIALAVLGALVVSFGGYYYWDRYVYPGDQSSAGTDIEQLEEAVRNAPQSPDMRLALAEQYLNARMYEDAVEQASQVLAVYPDNEIALLISGVAYTYLDQPEVAVDSLEGFAAARADDPMAHVDTLLETAYYYLGQSYIELARYEDAVRVLEMALEISSIDADAMYQLAVAYAAIDRPQTALEHYRRATTLVPDFAEAYDGMAECYSVLDQPEYATYATGMSAFSRQNYEPAQTYLEQAVDALPDFAPAFTGLGLVYEQLGEMDAASAAAEQALELDPDDFTAQRLYERIRLSTGQDG